MNIMVLQIVEKCNEYRRKTLLAAADKSFTKRASLTAKTNVAVHQIVLSTISLCFYSTDIP